DRLDEPTVARIADLPDLAEAFVAVVAASRSATRLVETDPAALDVLERVRLTAPPPGGVDGPPGGGAEHGLVDGGISDVSPGTAGLGEGGVDRVVGARDPDDLARAKRLAQLRITARDLLG